VRLAYFLGSILNLGVEKEQQMLEPGTVDDLICHAIFWRVKLRSFACVRRCNEAQTEMDKAQRDYVCASDESDSKKLGEDEGGEQYKRWCASAWPKPICRTGSQGSGAGQCMGCRRWRPTTRHSLFSFILELPGKIVSDLHGSE
jgi:hypothetical protein